MKSSILTTPLCPCLRGEALAKQGPGIVYLPQFRALVSAPSDRYAELYLETLHRFMELCQALPLTAPLLDNPGGIGKASLYSLVNHAFSLAVAALKMRRSWLMSLYDSDSEKIAQQEALWTYALLTTVLFRAIPVDWQTAYTVGLYQNEEKRLGTWHPVIGSLYEPHTFYKIENSPDKVSLVAMDHSALLTTWTGRLIPSIALRWLGNSEVFPVWWEALTHSAINSQNVLFKYLRQVAGKLGISLAESPVSPPTQSSSVGTTAQAAQSSAMTSTPVTPATAKTLVSSAQQALTRLNQWLSTQLELAAEARLFIRVESGLFIDETGLQRMIGQYAMYASVETLVKSLTEFLVTEEDSVMTRYRSIHFESREMRTGIVLATTHLSDDFKTLHVNKQFTPDLFIR
jgi:hypothetical protein